MDDNGASPNFIPRFALIGRQRHARSVKLTFSR